MEGEQTTGVCVSCGTPNMVLNEGNKCENCAGAPETGGTEEGGEEGTPM